jgi:hypothetical protein
MEVTVLYPERFIIAFMTAPLDLSLKLKREADFIIEIIHLQEILAAYGRITFTGSYYLDVMVYPDIDLYIPTVTIPQLFQIGGQIAQSDLVFQVTYENTQNPLMPGGLYLKPRIRFGDWGRPWKIDIWSLDETLIEQKMEPMHRFRAKMTEALREAIIQYKLSIMTHEHRTPMYSGYFIYIAFIDEGLTDFQEITHYLLANGIHI